MTRNLPITIIDVFAEQPLAGNQLAVVRDAAGLTDVQMQDIAREMNFSETTFVTAQQAGAADVRIFTPGAELPFAGHPTVGTAWQLSGGTGSITLNLAAGPVAVEFEDGVGWMTPPEVTFSGTLDNETAAELVGLSAEELGPLPVEFAQVGPQFVLVPVRTLASLKRARFDADKRAALIDAGHPAKSVFLFTDEAYDPQAQYASRMFFDAASIREDPATGSANTAFAAYLRKHLGPVGAVVVDQGVEMLRPSRLYLDIGPVIRVGGKVQPVLSGEISVPS